MEETLLQKQQRFTLMVRQLITQAHDMGYGITFGETWRPPQQAEYDAEHGTGIKHSLHCSRLAVDLNLFRGDVYLTRTDDYKALGRWWEQIGGTWGGRFGDGNHFSLAYDGKK